VRDAAENVEATLIDRATQRRVIDQHGPHQMAARNQRQAEQGGAFDQPLQDRRQRAVRPHAGGDRLGCGQQVGYKRPVFFREGQAVKGCRSVGRKPPGRPSHQTALIAIPVHDRTALDADQQRRQADDRLQTLIRVDLSVDGLGYLEQSGSDPGFFLLRGE